MKEKEIELSWEEFKEHMRCTENHDDEIVVFRGHASCTWKPQSTLERFLPTENCIRSSKYYSIVKKFAKKK